MSAIVDLATILVGRDVLLGHGACTVDIAHPVGRCHVLRIHKVGGFAVSANLETNNQTLVIYRNQGQCLHKKVDLEICLFSLAGSIIHSR